MNAPVFLATAWSQSNLGCVLNGRESVLVHLLDIGQGQCRIPHGEIVQVTGQRLWFIKATQQTILILANDELAFVFDHEIIFRLEFSVILKSIIN